MTAAVVIDIFLGLILVGLAAQVAIGKHLFRAIVFYVAFGLAMALIWARLGAPDLALADAAIGAGLTGALMMVAFRRLVEIDPKQSQALATRGSPLAVVLAVLAAGMVATIGLTALSLERQPGAAGLQVLATLPETGLGNPITGVLLAFRGFDTLIEMAVLLTAFVGSRVITTRSRLSVTTVSGFELPLVRTLVAVILPLAVLIGMHLLWIGSDQPGGAFQAGSVLAGSGVLLLLTGTLLPASRSRALVRLALVAGVGALCLLVLAPLALGDGPMAYLGRGSLLFAETAMMISIAVTLTLLFAGSPSLKAGGS
ncbi:MAG TPA: Na(+)/H(+) antiporter subunit B [Wenzhouxiangellaceae bacterium]|nr:Na(+)/H(+) antiporter subunit B [Wenzhouxiangellaceae bacterium]